MMKKVIKSSVVLTICSLVLGGYPSVASLNQGDSKSKKVSKKEMKKEAKKQKKLLQSQNKAGTPPSRPQTPAPSLPSSPSARSPWTPAAPRAPTAPPASLSPVVGSSLSSHPASGLQRCPISKDTSKDTNEIQHLKERIAFLENELANKSSGHAVSLDAIKSFLEDMKQHLQETFKIREKEKHDGILDAKKKRGEKLESTEKLQEIVAILGSAAEEGPQKVLASLRYFQEAQGLYGPEGTEPNPTAVEIIMELQNILGQTQNADIKKTLELYEQEARERDVMESLNQVKAVYDSYIQKGKEAIEEEAKKSPVLYFLLVDPSDSLRRFVLTDLIKALDNNFKYASEDDLKALLYHFGKNKGFSRGSTRSVFEKVEEFLQAPPTPTVFPGEGKKPVQLEKAKSNGDLVKPMTGGDAPDASGTSGGILASQDSTAATITALNKRIDAILNTADKGNFNGDFKKRLEALKGKNPEKTEELLDILDQYLSVSPDDFKAGISWRKIPSLLAEIEKSATLPSKTLQPSKSSQPSESSESSIEHRIDAMVKTANKGNFNDDFKKRLGALKEKNLQNSEYRKKVDNLLGILEQYLKTTNPLMENIGWRQIPVLLEELEHNGHPSNAAESIR